MERFGIVEMEFVADLHRMQEANNHKYDAFHVILDNNFHKVPEGWTVVFLRNTPVQVVPDNLVPDIQEMSVSGFIHEPENQSLVCLYDANSEAGETMFRAVMELVVGWMDANF